MARGFDRTIRANKLRCPDHFTGFVLTGRLTLESLRATIEKLPEGSTELMCHPGYVDAALAKASTNLLDQRQHELEALSNPQLWDALRGRGIQLTSFREQPLQTPLQEEDILADMSGHAAERAAAGEMK